MHFRKECILKKIDLLKGQEVDIRMKKTYYLDPEKCPIGCKGLSGYLTRMSVITNQKNRNNSPKL